MYFYFNSLLQHKFFVAAILIFFISSHTAAQCSGDIFLTTQEEVDHFDCVSVFEGRPTISGSDITNLDGLSGLTAVDGDLFIEDNPLLSSLEGLASLSSVSGNLFIEFNTVLQTLDGLSALTGIGEDLSIYGNASMTRLDGLTSLGYVGGNFYIFGNPSLLQIGNIPQLSTVGEALFIGGNENLQQINGMSALSSVGGFLFIYQNPRINQVNGLSGLNYVGSYIFIDHNEQLTHLNGLSGLNTVGGYLYIANNDSLIHLNGLNNVIHINGNIHLVDNASLNNISGISGIVSGVTGFSIYGNPALRNCSIASVCRIISGEFNEIFDNGGGCDSVEEVVENCVSDQGNNAARQCAPPSGVALIRLSDATFTFTADDSSEVYQGQFTTAVAAAPQSVSPALTSLRTRSSIIAPLSTSQTHFWLRTVCGAEVFSEWQGPYALPALSENQVRSARLSPNPTSGNVQITQVNARIIEVYDMNGVNLMNFNTRNNRFDISELPTGNYNLRITDTEGNVHFEQVIKK